MGRSTKSFLDEYITPPYDFDKISKHGMKKVLKCLKFDNRHGWDNELMKWLMPNVRRR